MENNNKKQQQTEALQALLKEEKAIDLLEALAHLSFTSASHLDDVRASRLQNLSLFLKHLSLAEEA